MSGSLTVVLLSVWHGCLNVGLTAVITTPSINVYHVSTSFPGTRESQIIALDSAQLIPNSY